MAVTLAPFDLMQPMGELDAAWFPDGDLELRIGGALALVAPVVEGSTAIAAANHNAAAAAWVYARLYRQVAARLAATPSTLTIGGQITRVTSADRVAYFANLAASKEAEYAGYSVVETTIAVPARSQRAKVTATW